MKTKVALVGTAMMLAAILMVPVALHAQETDPVEVCYGPAFEAFLAGEQAFDPSVWADEAVQTSIMGDMVTTRSGVEEIGAYMEELQAKNTEMEVTVLSVEGGTVTSENKVSDDEIRALGVAPLVGTEVCVVQDGKIQSLTWTMSDESLAALGAALAALPETGGEPAPGYAWFMALGGFALAAGLGANYVRRRVQHLQ